MSAFVKASAYALTQSPTVNAVIDGTDIVYRDYVDISVAVATPKVCLLKFLYSGKAGKMSKIILFFLVRLEFTLQFEIGADRHDFVNLVTPSVIISKLK